MGKTTPCAICLGELQSSSTLLVETPFLGSVAVCWDCACRVSRTHKRRVLKDGSGYYPTDVSRIAR